jgi:plasmid stability protein
MDTTGTVNAQVTLPTELYRAIEQRAQKHGHSLSSEIAALLTDSLGLATKDLNEEFALWEAASDEDWLTMETMLAAEEH